MVVTLLGIVVATLVPRMLSANEETRQNALLLRLHSVRRRIVEFRQVHDGRLPAEGRNSADELLGELRSLESAASDSQSSDAAVLKVDNGLPPLNPYTKKSDILVIPDRLQSHHYSGSGRHGWAYSSTTGEFRANLAPQVTDRSGRLINQL
jgi:type II secretory pathway pseudopilin PulG